MISARLTLDADFRVGELDPRIFGAFVEHVGRCIYTGLYEPGHPLADAQGYRRDVLALTRELGVTLVRYPGGNFLSGYDWEDGVGPPAQRPRRLDLAWRSTESNQFGTDEFIGWCRAAGVEPMLGVNLGTRGADTARRLVEYCNHPGGTELAERRRRNGHAVPHGVRHWCLGNEMDAPWQIGQKTAPAYGALAREAARQMRAVSPQIVLTACGSSNRDLPGYGRWEDAVLEECFDEVDLLSVHAYFENPHADTLEFLANIDRMDLHIAEAVAVADAVAARRRSARRIHLAVDEWNIWYRARHGEHAMQPGWPEAPDLLAEVYNVEDALAAAGALMVLLNHADRVKVACLAQLVNAIGAIRTRPGGGAWRQTLFHAFAPFAQHARGSVLRGVVDSPAASTRTHPQVPYLVACATLDAPGRQGALFALNRHLGQALDLHVVLRGLEATPTVAHAGTLHHADLQACNSEDAPDAVAPAALADVRWRDGVLRAQLRPASFNVLLLRW